MKMYAGRVSRVKTLLSPAQHGAVHPGAQTDPPELSVE